jgi:hypothetical protein
MRITEHFASVTHYKMKILCFLKVPNIYFTVLLSEKCNPSSAVLCAHPSQFTPSSAIRI